MHINFRVLYILGNSPDECYLNTTAIADSLLLSPKRMSQRNLILACPQPRVLYWLPYEGPKYLNIIQYIQIVKCVIDYGSVHTMASLGNLKVLIIHFGSLFTRNATELTDSSYSHMDTVVSFYYTEAGLTNEDVMGLFKNDTVYPNMAEIMISNNSWVNIPIYLPVMFPNLQSLEIPRNNITALQEDFPWTNDTASLPNNLSRTDYMHHHYAGSEYLDIPPYLFRRIYNLAYNRITNLCNFTFTGYIQKIKLHSNGLVHMCENAFVNVIGLQNLVLSRNELHELQEDVFQHQKHLKNLDLSHNKLTNISGGVFRDTVALKVLNLANNTLQHLSPGAFVNLKSLEVLFLQNNSLEYLEAPSFPIDTVKLKIIYLQNNPLKVLPELIFWIRGLNLADLRYTDVQFENFTNYLMELDYSRIAGTIVDSGSDTDLSDLLKQDISPTVIDLSFSKVATMPLLTNISVPPRTQELASLAILLLHFQFDLTGNPITCDCNMNAVIKFINMMINDRIISDEDALFNTWKCRYPLELNGTDVVHILPEQTVCPIEVADCPSECDCYKRPGLEHVIVDCRWKYLEEIHSTLPAGKLELWYSGNNLTELVNMDVLERAVALDLSHNKIKTVRNNAFNNMHALETLDLRSNLLVSLPQNIQKLKLKEVFLTPNPFQCDCKTRWLKEWLLGNKLVIKDWHQVTCATGAEDGQVFVEARDDMFVCKSNVGQFDELKHVVLPSVVSSVLGVLIVSFIIVLYAFRLEVKVLLFIYFGLHPFDGDGQYTDEYIDCVIVHSGFQIDWVMEKLVSVLENVNYNFVVCDMARDFVVGFSFQENLTKTVNHSKRMIFIITDDWQPVSDRFSIAWGIAQNKIKETRSNFGIIVTHEVAKDQIDDEDLQLFMKRGRFVDSSEKLFENKILYYMPLQKSIQRHRVGTSVSEIHNSSEVMSKCFTNKAFTSSDSLFSDKIAAVSADASSKCHAFVSYGDDDLDYATRVVMPVLEENNLTFRFPDRDFIVGASKEENILHAIRESSKTIFVLSPSHVSDEWSLFTFRAAYEKSLREKTNHLIVIIKVGTDVDKDIEDDEVKHYVKNYICLKEKDRWFKQRLLSSLSVVSNCEDQSDTLDAQALAETREIEISVCL